MRSPRTPARTIVPDDIFHQNKRDMKTHTNAKSTRIIETILVLFISSFLYRAIPNLNEMRIFEATFQTFQMDDQYWGHYTHIEFMATNPTPGKAQMPKIVPVWKSPKTFPVLPGKYWLCHRDFEA